MQNVIANVLFTNAWDSPFIVPVAGCLMILGIVIAGSVSSFRARQLESMERLAAIEKGLPLPPTKAERELSQPQPPASGKRYANIRLTGIVLTFTGIGMMLFFALLEVILRQREILSGVAVGLIPLAVGIGFLVDARMQKRELDKAAQLLS
jgi:hypothetical protein